MDFVAEGYLSASVFIILLSRFCSAAVLSVFLESSSYCLMRGSTLSFVFCSFATLSFNSSALSFAVLACFTKLNMAAPRPTMAAMAIAYGLESNATRSLASAFDAIPVAVASATLALISLRDIASATAFALASDISPATNFGIHTVLLLRSAFSYACLIVNAVVATVAAFDAAT